MRFECEMACVEQNYLCMWHVPFECLRTGGDKEGIVPAPDGQYAWLPEETARTRLKSQYILLVSTG